MILGEIVLILVSFGIIGFGIYNMSKLIRCRYRIQGTIVSLRRRIYYNNRTLWNL